MKEVEEDAHTHACQSFLCSVLKGMGFLTSVIGVPERASDRNRNQKGFVVGNENRCGSSLASGVDD